MTFIEQTYFFLKIKVLIRNLIFGICLCFIFNGFSQDIQFSQFYASSLYINPAFAGSSHMGRLISHSRYQWPGIDAKYATSLFSFDFFHPKTNSGLGIYALKDYQGKQNITSTELALMYSYQLPLSEKLTLRLGIQGTYVSRYINYSILNFPDQFNDNGRLDNTPTSEPFGDSKVKYGDVSAGTVLYSKKLWLSLASYHMNRPNQSFYNNNSRLPIKYTLSGGHKFVLKKKTIINKGEHVTYLVPSANYKFQGKSDQLDLGVYYLQNILVAGIWYRGLPLIKRYDNTIQNNESMAALLGVKLKDFGITYSYDFVVSKLTNTRPFGAHELNLVYVFPYPKKMKKVRRVLPCPDFQR